MAEVAAMRRRNYLADATSRIIRSADVCAAGQWLLFFTLPPNTPLNIVPGGHPFDNVLITPMHASATEIWATFVRGVNQFSAGVKSLLFHAAAN